MNKIINSFEFACIFYKYKYYLNPDILQTIYKYYIWFMHQKNIDIIRKISFNEINNIGSFCNCIINNEIDPNYSNALTNFWSDAFTHTFILQNKNYDLDKLHNLVYYKIYESINKEDNIVNFTYLNESKNLKLDIYYEPCWIYLNLYIFIDKYYNNSIRIIISIDNLDDIKRNNSVLERIKINKEKNKLYNKYVKSNMFEKHIILEGTGINFTEINNNIKFDQIINNRELDIYHYNTIDFKIDIYQQINDKKVYINFYDLYSNNINNIIKEKIDFLFNNKKKEIFFANIFKNDNNICIQNSQNNVYIGNLEGYLQWFYDNFIN